MVDFAVKPNIKYTKYRRNKPYNNFIKNSFKKMLLKLC